jgi:murein DD-endopeptidase MepM/ murein hydrolase activator NlpD
MRFVRTSNFGALEEIRGGVPHSGVDYSMEIGTKLESVGSGIIQKIVDYGDVNAGKTIIMKLDSGQEVVYGHLSRFLVEEGQRVAPGQLIGLSGNTGLSTGPHLHFSVKENGSFVPPDQFEPKIQEMANHQSYWDQILENGKVDSYKGADQVEGFLDPGSLTEKSARYLIDQLSELAHEVGIWLLKIAPEVSMTLAMIFCLGAIMSIPKMGKWASIATIGAVVADVIKRATIG